MRKSPLTVQALPRLLCSLKLLHMMLPLLLLVLQLLLHPLDLPLLLMQLLLPPLHLLTHRGCSSAAGHLQ